MTPDRASWLAAAAWSAVAVVALFAFPPGGIAMVVTGLLVAGTVAVARRRLHVLSGGLSGFGGLFVGLWAIRAAGCAAAVECEGAGADGPLVAGALAVLGAGVGLALLDRRRGQSPPPVSD